MRKMMVKNRKSKGFTLAEVLVVVAIIGILASLSFVAVAKYKRDLKGLEMDASAKELFIAAQNHLSFAESQALLDKDTDSYGWDAAGNAEDASKGIYWFIVGDAPVTKSSVAGGNFTSSPSDKDSVLSLMIPIGSIEEAIRTEGSYIIRYQKEPAQVLDVFFAERNGVYPHTFATSEYLQLMNYGVYEDTSNYRENSNLRRNYGADKAVIGYYGGTAASDATIGKELKAPVLYLNEGNILSVVVHDPNPLTEPHSLSITFTGETSGPSNAVTIPLLVQINNGMVSITANDALFPTDPSYQYIKDNIDKIVKYNKTDGTFTFIMDDITTPGLHFAEIFGNTGLIPGEKINIQAEASNSQALTNVAKSNIVSTYVLFDDITIDEYGNTVIEVSNIRQLENLDPDISGFDQDALDDLGITGDLDIHQSDDIDFDDFLDDVNKDKGLPEDTPVYIFEIGDDEDDMAENGGDIQPNTFNPIDTDYHMDYDGENNTISNIVVNTDGDAGLFGSLSEPSSNPSTHITVRDVELVDFDISSTDGNAGVLAGTLNNANITGVLVRNTFNDPDHGVIAGNNAGGLVGQMNGGSAVLCSANTFVQSTCLSNSETNDGNAGGLVGKVTGIIGFDTCYAGGHTRDAKYQKETTGTARINVRGNNSAGGFIGNAKQTGAELNVKYCYTTCSVMGAVSDGTATKGSTGGFIGSANTSAKIKYCYAAGKVYPTQKTAPGAEHTTYELAASGPVSPFAGEPGNAANYQDASNTPLNGFLMGVCDNAKVEPTAKAYSAKDYSATGTFVIENNRNAATTFDKTLAARFAGKYTFKTLSQLNPGLTGLGAVANKLYTTQLGDWQLPNITALKGKLTNEDVLKFEFQLEENTIQAVLAITGENSGKTRLFLFDITDGTVALSQLGHVTNASIAPEIGDIDWETDTTGISKFKWTTGASSIESGKTSVTFMLDDITKADSHFNDFFGDILTPGEDIAVRIASGNASWGEICNMLDSSGSGEPAKPHKANSLFARSDEDRVTFNDKDQNGAPVQLVADITHVRHLQNLDPSVSSVSSKVTSAVMYGDVTWNASTYNEIYNSDSSKHASASFVGIYNPNIALFDGQNHTIKNLNVRAAVSGFVTATYTTDETAGSVGLFRQVSNSMTIKNTKLQDFNVSSSGYAGTLIGNVKSGSAIDVKINTVLASSANNTVKSTGSAAGGLVGYQSGNRTTLEIINSASNMRVAGRSYAGGLIGATQGNVSIAQSYVGGHTQNSKYNVTVSGDSNPYNIAAVNADGVADAGGLIGSTTTVGSVPTKITINQSFNAASVYSSCNNLSQYAGGLIGLVYNPATSETTPSVTILNSFTVAPVSNVLVKKADTDTPTNSNGGALIGQIGNSSSVICSKVYFLPEIYPENENDASGKSYVQYVGRIDGRSRIMGTIDTVLYTKDKNDIVSATGKDGSPQDKTVAFDTTLTNKYSVNKEFPFSIWTKFSFDGLSNKRVYYGDWQPGIIGSTVICDVTFYKPIYLADVPLLDQPGTAYSSSEISRVQQVHKGERTTVTLPKSVPQYKGYEFSGWTVSYTDDISGNTVSYFIEASASAKNITIPAAYCGGNLSITATYRAAANWAITFYYDPEGGTDYVKLAESTVVEGSTFSDIASKVPAARQVSNYTFIGWFDEDDNEFDFTDSTLLATVIDQDYQIYAKYEPISYFTITVNYLFRKNETSGVTALGVQPLTLRYLKGETYSDVITIPGTKNMGVNSIRYDVAEGEDMMTGAEVNESIASVTTNTDKTLALHINVSYDDANNGVFEINVILEPTAQTQKSKYLVVHVLHDTGTDGTTYEAGKLYSKPIITGGTGASAYTGEDYVGQLPKVDVTSEPGYYSNNSFISNTTPLEAGKITTITIDYYRETYTLVFDSMAGSYVAPTTFVSGEKLADKINSAGTPTRTGYTFNGWAVHDMGAANDSEQYKYTGSYKDTTTPGNNLKACAKWTGQPTEYSVAFWYEKSESTDENNKANYTYMGSLPTRKNGTTGQIAEFDITDYNKMNADWKTKEGNYFTYNSTLTKPITLAGDGSSVLNVYFTRNSYTLTFKAKNDTCGLETHTHTADCYEFTCTKPEHTHDASRLNCTHSHNASCYGVDTSKGKPSPDTSWANNKNDNAEFISELGVTDCCVYRYENKTPSGFLNFGTTTTYHNYLYYDGKYYTITDETIYKIIVDTPLASGSFDGNNYRTDSYWKYPAKPGACTHTHNASCYNCGYEEHTHTDYTGSCYSLICTVTSAHTHTGDCNSTDRTNTVRQVTRKYKADIRDVFPVVNQVTKKDYTATRWKADVLFTQVLASLDTMPGANITLTVNTSSGTGGTIKYYVETVENETPETNVKIGTVTYPFTLHKTVVHKFNYLTRDEEFHDIEGFTQFAYKLNNGTPSTSIKDKYDISKNSDVYYFYYRRNSYNLNYVMEGVTKKTEGVQFEKSLSSYGSYVPTDAPSGMIFGGWCSDPECSTPFDFDNEKMPSGNLVVYGKWVYPSFNVQVKRCESDTGVISYTSNGANVSLDLSIEKFKNIGDYIYNPDGSMKFTLTRNNAAGKPMEFLGWAYRDSSGKEQDYNCYTGITDNITIYGKWDDPNAVTTATVTIRYFEVVNGEEIPLIVDGAAYPPTVVEDCDVNTLYTAYAPKIPGFYSLNLSQTITVSSDSAKNNISIDYKRLTSWNYQVQYYVRYSPTVDLSSLGTGVRDRLEAKLGATFSETVSAWYPILNETRTETLYMYTTVPYASVPGFTNYRVLGYEILYNTDPTNVTAAPDVNTLRNNSIATCQMGDQAVIRFYLEPDASAVSLPELYEIYNGLTHNIVSKLDNTSNVFSDPEQYFADFSTHALDITLIYDRPGDDAIDANTYMADAYVVLEGPDGNSYLIRREDRNINPAYIVVEPRKVELSSKSASKAWDGTALTCTGPDTYSMRSLESDGLGAFIGTDGIAEFIPARTAFRVDKGKEDNAFSFTLTEGTKSGNYDIRFNFGILEVY